MTSVSCSLLEHLSLFTISSLIFGSRGCSHFTALPHTCHPFSPPDRHTHTPPPPPFLVDYSFNFLKAEASIGMVQLQERGIGWGCWKAVGIYKCCERSEIWEPYFNTCEAECARTPSCTQTRVRRHTSA